MWNIIKKGRHRACPFSFGIHNKKIRETYHVIFDGSCAYQLPEEDQLDWNKLGGWSYGLHHNNSVRIGWRYNPTINMIEMCLYEYVNGVRTVNDNHVIAVHLNNIIQLDLKLTAAYRVTLIATGAVKHPNKPNLITRLYGSKLAPSWGYNLGIYFGGNCTQPNNNPMKIWMKKLKKY
jgi:hypothetical protein